MRSREVRRRKRYEQGEASRDSIELAEPIMFGVLRLKFEDGYEAILDLRSKVKNGAIWRDIKTQDEFFDVRLDDYGSALYWGEPNGETVLSADGCRFGCEQQALLIEAMDDRRTRDDIRASLQRLADG